MNKFLYVFSSFVLFLICVGNANADPTIGFSLDGIVFTDNFTVNVGDSITVQVYAIEGTDTRLTADGLQNIGTLATYSTSFGTVTGVLLDTGNFPVDTGSTFDNGLGELELQGLTFTPANNAGSDILLGEFTFMATSIGATVFDFADLEPSSISNFTLGDVDGTDLDPDIFGPTRATTYPVTINSVPEPAVFVLTFLACVAVGFRRCK